MIQSITVPHLHRPQALVLRALMPRPGSENRPVLSRIQLAQGAGYSPTSGTITRALHGIPNGSSRRKKEKVLAVHGKLLCKVCDFDFALVYGVLGKDFAECHHRVPLAELEEGHPVRLSDLAIVCANCHRMLHRRPRHTVEKLRKIV